MGLLAVLSHAPETNAFLNIKTFVSFSSIFRTHENFKCEIDRRMYCLLIGSCPAVRL